MASEKFANRPSSTVAVAYTATDLTLEVADASGFPATGVFRVILGNAEQTIFRVDSVAGDVFTGAAEAFDGDAAIGVTVKIVASKAVAERFIQSPEAAEIFAPSGLAAVDRWGPLHKVAYPVTADYAWQNQGTSTVDDQFGFTRLAAPSASTSVRSRIKTAPSTPYSFEVMLRVRDVSASKYAGFLFRESSTGKLVMFYVLTTTNVAQVVYFTNDTTFSSAPTSGTLEGSAIGSLAPVFLRCQDNGTNLLFSASRDGKYYFTNLSVLRAAHMLTGANQVGFFANVDSAAGVFAVDFYSFRQL